MTDETKGNEEVETVETETAVEQSESTEVTPETTDKKESKKGRGSVSERINKLTFEREEEKRRRIALAEENARLKEQVQLKSEPDPDDYADSDKLEKDKAQWKTQERDRMRFEISNELKQEKEDQRQAEHAAEAAENWSKQQNKGRNDYEDFNGSENLVLSAVRDFGAYGLRDTIIESEHGAGIVDYLGQNEDELHDIARLPLTTQTRRILRIEAKLAAKPAKKVSTAPAPTSSEKGSAAPSNKSMKDLTWKERCALVNKR